MNFAIARKSRLTRDIKRRFKNEELLIEWPGSNIKKRTEQQFKYQDNLITRIQVKSRTRTCDLIILENEHVDVRMAHEDGQRIIWSHHLEASVALAILINNGVLYSAEYEEYEEEDQIRKRWTEVTGERLLYHYGLKLDLPPEDIMLSEHIPHKATFTSWSHEDYAFTEEFLKFLNRLRKEGTIRRGNKKFKHTQEGNEEEIMAYNNGDRVFSIELEDNYLIAVRMEKGNVFSLMDEVLNKEILEDMELYVNLECADSYLWIKRFEQYSEQVNLYRNAFLIEDKQSGKKVVLRARRIQELRESLTILGNLESHIYINPISSQVYIIDWNARTTGIRLTTKNPRKKRKLDNVW